MNECTSLEIFSPWVMISQTFITQLYVITYICHIYTLKWLKYYIRKIIIFKKVEAIVARTKMSYFIGKADI